MAEDDKQLLARISVGETRKIMQQYVDSDESVYLEDKCGCGRADVVMWSEEQGWVVYNMASLSVNATTTNAHGQVQKWFAEL